jgi:hypothetical protein
MKKTGPVGPAWAGQAPASYSAVMLAALTVSPQRS